jgi:hypothetical protein
LPRRSRLIETEVSIEVMGPRLLLHKRRQACHVRW